MIRVFRREQEMDIDRRALRRLDPETAFRHSEKLTQRRSDRRGGAFREPVHRTAML